MNCGVCTEEFTQADQIFLIWFGGERVFAHARDCSLSRDGGVLARHVSP